MNEPTITEAYGHWSTFDLALKGRYKEVLALREAIDKSNEALAEAVKVKEERDRLLLQNDELKKFIESVGCDHGCELAPFEMSYHLPGCVVTRRKALFTEKRSVSGQNEGA